MITASTLLNYLTNRVRRSKVGKSKEASHKSVRGNG